LFLVLLCNFSFVVQYFTAHAKHFSRSFFILSSLGLLGRTTNCYKFITYSELVIMHASENVFHCWSCLLVENRIVN